MDADQAAKAIAVGKKALQEGDFAKALKVYGFFLPFRVTARMHIVF
jgi:hypothetical protein